MCVQPCLLGMGGRGGIEVTPQYLFPCTMLVVQHTIHGRRGTGSEVPEKLPGWKAEKKKKMMLSICSIDCIFLWDICICGTHTGRSSSGLQLQLQCECCNIVMSFILNNFGMVLYEVASLFLMAVVICGGNG